MKAGVGSRGSPMPKSIRSMPRAEAAAFQSSRRANGYWASSARTGESCMPRRYRAGRSLPERGGSSRHEALEWCERPLELGDLDPLVGRVGVARPAGAEVDGVEA